MATSIYDRILKQAVLTEAVTKRAKTELETEAYKGLQIAPIYNTNSQYMRMTSQAEHATGVGQFVSPEGTPPLVDTPGREADEKIFEMLRLDEQIRISPTRYEAMVSTDENIAGQAIHSLIDLGVMLAERNARLIELKRWEAFLTNQVTESVNVNGDPADINTIVVPDYGIPSTNRVNAGTLWTNTANADVVAQLSAWRKKVAEETGFPATKCHITSEDAELLLANETIKTYFNIEPGQVFRPSLNDIAGLVAAGVGSFEFVVYDGGFRNQSVGASQARVDHVRYLPVGKVLLTTDYTVAGTKIADTPNGRVDIMTGFNSAALVQGPVSEFLVDQNSKQRLLRYASRAIPRVNIGGAFFTATVR